MLDAADSVIRGSEPNVIPYPLDKSALILTRVVRVARALSYPEDHPVQLYKA